MWKENRKRTYFYGPERFFRKIITEGVKETEYKILVGEYIPGTGLTTHTNCSKNRTSEDAFIQYKDDKRKNSDELIVDQNGNILNPLNFSLGGVWYDYRLADRLPLTYRMIE